MGDIRSACPDDFQSILALNEAVVELTAPMDRERLTLLDELSAYHRVYADGGQVLAFLLVFREGSAYDSVNYRWFSKRLKDFLYIDRIVVSEEARSLGIGQRFYSEIERWSRQNRLAWLAAEVDIEPPNSASLKFHERQNFVEVGRQRIAGDKVVSLCLKSIGG